MKNAQNKTFQKLKLAADSIFLFRYIDKGDDLIEELSVNEPGGSPSVNRIDVYIPFRFNQSYRKTAASPKTPVDISTTPSDSNFKDGGHTIKNRETPAYPISQHG